MAVVSNKSGVKTPPKLDSVLTMKPTARVERIRDAFFSLKATPSIDRARVETKVMRETEGEPMGIRRAKSFAAMAREIPIEIYPDELLMGYSHIKPRALSIVPSAGLEARMEAGREYTPRRSGPADQGHDMPDLSTLSDEEKRELKEELIPYWKGKGKIMKPGGYGHNIVDYEKVLQKGFLGIKKEAEERLAGLDLAEPGGAAKVQFLESAVMVLEAASEFGKRYAALARERAEGESDPARKADLLRVAEVCDWVPANPARNFYEAVQSCYFAWLLTCWENSLVGGQSLGRMDQYLYPYYDDDMKEERITNEEALELIDCLLFKVNHGPPVAAISVGGVGPNGHDVTNPLSYMFIEGMMHTRLRQPYFSVQVHQRMPDALLIKACELCSLGTGHPEFINNDVMVSQALARGSMGGPPVTLADARSASPIGCLEMGIPGKDSGYLYFQQPNLAACMDLVMTNGLRRADGKKTGAETGDPRKFESFEEVQEAYRKQVAWMKNDIQVAGTIMEQNVIENAQTPFESALIGGCIEKGMGREVGGAHFNFNIGGAALGPTDAGDSLAAIKKVVFDDKKFTMDELCDALDNNFEGYESLHRALLKAPKFGNDDDYGDEQTAWVTHEWVSEFTKLKNMRGGYGCPGGSVMGGYVPAGRAVGALPSGRLAGEPLVDGASPCSGQDIEGPTAVFKSMGKLDNVEILGGAILNLRLDPSIFKNGDVGRLADLIRAFIDQKIYHVQINVVSSDVLKAAQREPDKHRDLVVKVAGYNAFFTDLGEAHQNTVIARTEHDI